MIFTCVSFILVTCVLADEKILHVIPGCPATSVGIPHPVVRADVPAEVTATCKNGDKIFTSRSGVKHVLSATLSQSYVGGDCQYYKKKGVNTYTLNIAIAWSEPGKEIYTQREIHTITCVYDRYGNATSNLEKLAPSFLNPPELQYLKGEHRMSANFSLSIIDVLDREVSEDHLHIGRLIRLRAIETTGSVVAFRALSCTASNSRSTYAILRAGCGDGLVFEKTEGFETIGRVVYSPFFDAFKLDGSVKVHFECNFTICESSCNGYSCPSIPTRSKRSLSDQDHPETSQESATLNPESVLNTPGPVLDIEGNSLRLNEQEMAGLDHSNHDHGRTLGDQTANSDELEQKSKPTKNNSASIKRCAEDIDCYNSLFTDVEFLAKLFIVFGSLLMLSFGMSLYLCCKYEISQLGSIYK